jgi:hypothetical protein
MNLAEFQQLMAEHGGLAGTSIHDPLVDTGIPGAPKEPNPTPTYVYTFNDGTRLAARSEPDGTFAITDWGTAGPNTKRSSASNMEQVRDPRTNEIIALRDPISGQVISLPKQSKTGMPGTIAYIPGTKIPVGIYDETGSYRDLTATEQKALGAATGEGVLGAGGSGGGGGGTGRTVFPWEADVDVAQARLLNAQAAAAEQKLKPELGLLLENHLKVIDQVQAMLESGQIKSVAEADAILDLANQNLQAAMQGATPFQMAKQKSDTDTQRAQIGQSIVNQRLQTGGTLAQSLMNMFSNNLDTLGWGLQPGQTVNFDPFTIARQYTNDLGGGAQMGELGKALLGQLQPQLGGGAQTPTAAPPQTAANGGLPANLALAVQMAEEADRRGVQQPQEVMANG